MIAMQRPLEMLPCGLMPDHESLFFAGRDDPQDWGLARTSDRLAHEGPAPTRSAAEVTAGLGRPRAVSWLDRARGAGCLGGTWSA